jgi:hypothetical protein
MNSVMIAMLVFVGVPSRSSVNACCDPDPGYGVSCRGDESKGRGRFLPGVGIFTSLPSPSRNELNPRLGRHR